MKITREQLKQIIKEELGDWTPEMQRRARHSPGFAAHTGPGEPPPRASRERAAQTASPAVPDADRILQDMEAAYISLEGSPGDQKLLEDDLLNGLGDLAAAWQKERFELAREQEEGY